MVAKGATSLVVNHREAFLSSIFLVPKKGGGHRPIINLKKLNEFIPHHHFKMEGIQKLKYLLRQGLHDEDRFEGCILCSPDKRLRQETFEVQVERQTISVQLPTFWAIVFLGSLSR